jgi:hypothetical protein
LYSDQFDISLSIIHFFPIFNPHYFPAMKSLSYLVLFLLIILGWNAFSQPGSNYPPPANVTYHNDTLTICPPDSLPGDPVILVAYNIYVDSAFFDNTTVTNPSDTIDYIFTFPALPPGNHSFCVNAVYNLWISDQACDSATVIYGYELPFLEDWSSGNFEELQWTSSSGNWVISNEEGNPPPAAEFRGDPIQTNYAINLESYPINVLGMVQGTIFFDYYLKLDNSHTTGNEKMQVQVWNWKSNIWSTVAEYKNDQGSHIWASEHLNIKAHAMNKIFRVRFLATGVNSADIQGWTVDNIHLYRSCLGPTELELTENLDYNDLTWNPPSGCVEVWLHWDDGQNYGDAIGTGGAAEFDVAARWESDQLPDFYELDITRIDFFPAESQAIYHVRVWRGEGPDTLIADQLVTSPAIGEWNSVTLDEPVTIDNTEDLWVGYHVSTLTGYPASVDNGPEIDGYGNMINIEGSWKTLLELNPDLHYNWNILCYGFIYQSHVDYNIYRKTNGEEFQLISTIHDITFRDTNVYLPDYYCYNVTMLWTKYADTCESDPTNTVCETVNVGINQPGQVPAIKIYPNPAKTWLNIESEEEIRSVKIYNLLGEEVLKLEIGNLEARVDVSRLRSGIYYVNVTTVGGNYKEKIVILR